MVIVDPPLEELARLAAEIAAQGYPVFPCDYQKAPMRGTHGHLDATDNPKLAYDLIMSHRDARMIGVPMGVKAMLVCVDVDPDGMTWLRANWHRLGDTLMHRTPRGGCHLIYKMPKPPCPVIDCRQVCEGKKLLSVGVDVKGEGGYIVWAGPKYEVINPIPPADMPIWMKNRLIRQPKQKEVRQVQIHPGARALEGALARVAYTKEGERNNLLFWAACRAGELVGKGIITEAQAIKVCAAAGRQAGLPELAALRTIKSGLKTGRGH